MRSKQRRRLVFIDRDGTLIVEKGYLANPDRVQLLRGTVEGLKLLRQEGFIPVVITNQSGIGRGLVTAAEAASVRQRFESLLRKKGARLAGYYACVHSPTAKCRCRKPGTVLLQRAARRFKSPLKDCFSIGDKPIDVLMGQRAGGKGILVKTGWGRKSVRDLDNVHPEFIGRRFLDAVRWILRQKRKDS